MIISPSRRRAAAALLGALGAVVTSARAQAPLDIVPVAPSEPAPPAVEPVSPGEPVEVGKAAAPDPEAAGAIDAAAGGFPFAMWQGTPRPLVEALLPRLPAETTSAAVRALVRRLLASAAAPPEGRAGTSLLALRAERLAAMGDGGAVNALLRALPPGFEDRRIWRVRLDSLLLAADTVNACALAKDLVARDDDPYWEETLIFCQALKGGHAKAALGLSLLRERGAAVDDGFVALLAAMRDGEAADLSRLARPNALEVAMLKAARVPIPAFAAETAGPAAARAFALAATVAPEIRVRAAERAEALGTLPATALAEVYDGIAFPPEELARPLSRAESDRSPLARALLHQAAAAQTVPAARAEVIRVALGHAAKATGFTGFATAARLYAGMIAGLPVSPELAWFAGDAARALYAVDRPDAARAWLSLADEQASVDASAADAVARLWPIARLADDSVAWDDDRLAAWWAAHEKDPALARESKAVRLFALLEAAGATVSAERLVALIGDAPLAWSRTLAAVLAERLEAAAREGRLGETVLLAAVGFADDTGQPSPLALTMAVAALGRVGLRAEARRLAVEAALAADFGG